MKGLREMKVSLYCMHSGGLRNRRQCGAKVLDGSICRCCHVSKHRWPGSRSGPLCRGTVLRVQLQERALAPGGCYAADSAARAARARQDLLEQPVTFGRLCSSGASKPEGLYLLEQQLRLTNGRLRIQWSSQFNKGGPRRAGTRTVPHGIEGGAQPRGWGTATRVGHSNEPACARCSTARRSRAWRSAAHLHRRIAHRLVCGHHLLQPPARFDKAHRLVRHRWHRGEVERTSSILGTICSSRLHRSAGQREYSGTAVRHGPLPNHSPLGPAGQHQLNSAGKTRLSWAGQNTAGLGRAQPAHPRRMASASRRLSLIMFVQKLVQTQLNSHLTLPLIDNQLTPAEWPPPRAG